MELSQLVARQRARFESGGTRPAAWRAEQLRRLRHALCAHESQLLTALHADLRKSAQEAYASELGLVIGETEHALRHLHRWMRPRRCRTPWLSWPARAYQLPQPLGVCAIVGPWNYPVQLLLSPLVSAMAAGNCAVIKASEFAPTTSRCIAELINAKFPDDYVHVVQGDASMSRTLLQQRFDHIFFTGGGAAGREVLAAAARHLTPVTLELGGKCPCVVCADASLGVAARRIAWGKFMNAGQTCLAPDYVLADKRIVEPLIESLGKALKGFYGSDPQASGDYGRIVNRRHFDRLINLLGSGRTVVGGQFNAADLYIAPTVITDVQLDRPIMQEEIFGPILPVVPYDDLDEAMAIISGRPAPLAVYLFTRDRSVHDRFIAGTRSGSVCTNDTLLQAVGSDLPMGGVGESGMGRYHGRAGFDGLSQQRTVMHRPLWFDPNSRYPPPSMDLARFRKLFRWLIRT